MRRMNWMLAGMLLVAGGCKVQDSQAGDRLEIGDTMPKQDIEMKNVDGTQLTLGEIAKENGTLVVFACNHCPFVQAWQDRLVRIGNDAVQRDIGVVFINANDPADYPTDDFEHMQQQAKKEGYKFPYVVDPTSDVARAFGAKRTPEVFLFDGNMKLAYHGAVDDNTYKPDEVKSHYLCDAIDALLADEEIPVKQTKSVGCSIKFRD